MSFNINSQAGLNEFRSYIETEYVGRNKSLP